MIGRGQWHNIGSIWNKQLAPDAALAPTSSDFVQRLFRIARYSMTSDPVHNSYDPPFNTIIDRNQYTIAVYQSSLDHPRVKVTYAPGGIEAAPGAAGNLQAVWMEVPLPILEECLPGSNDGGSDHQIGSNGSDSACTVICGNEMWEFFVLKPWFPIVDDEPRPDLWTPEMGFRAGYGGYVQNFRSWSGLWRIRNGIGWGTRASGVSSLGGLITAEDCERGEINHMLVAAIGCTGTADSSPPYINPVKRGDEASHGLEGSAAAINADRIPHGARFRLPAEFDDTAIAAHVAAVALTQPAVDQVLLAAMCRAIRDYSLMVVDSSGVGIQLQAEDTRTFGTIYNPYASRPTGLGPFSNTNNALSWAVYHLPWQDMQQIAQVDPLNEMVLGYDRNGAPKMFRRY